jgi:hypothetical protein
MPKESFLYSETQPVFDLIEEASRRSGVSRGQSFEDFILMSVCALSGGQMEEQYLATVSKHTEAKSGKCGCDSIAKAFGMLVHVMEETRQDILGDIFQGAITYGEAGQFLTPEPVCKLMASMTVGDAGDEEGSGLKTIADPCCGSGRMLLAVADLKPHWEFFGQDFDLRCVRMTAINLALRNLYGYVVWGNSLGLEKRLVYRTGFNLRGVIREIPLTDCPAPVQQAAAQHPTHTMPEAQNEAAIPLHDDAPIMTGKQLRLF